MPDLDTLLQIASAATQKLDGDDWLYDMTGVTFEETFTPSLITKMIEEIKRGREFMDDLGFTPTKVKAYDKAREALDAELGSV